jgi:hypothetical protein
MWIIDIFIFGGGNKKVLNLCNRDTGVKSSMIGIKYYIHIEYTQSIGFQTVLKPNYK